MLYNEVTLWVTRDNQHHDALASPYLGHTRSLRLWCQPDIGLPTGLVNILNMMPLLHTFQ